MKKRIRPIVCAALAAACLAFPLSCGIGGIGKKPPSRNYYIINYTPDAKKPAASMRPFPFSLQVQRFEVQRVYSRQNIVYRFAPQELKWYEYQQWAVRTDYMITDIVFKHIEAAGLFNRVGTEFLESRPDFRLEGTVNSLERLDAGDLIYGHLSMSFRVVRTADGVQVWEDSFDDRKQVFQPSMVYTVIALSQIMETRMNTVVGRLDSLFTVMGGGTPSPVDVRTLSKAPGDSAGKANIKGYEIIPESRIKRK